MGKWEDLKIIMNSYFSFSESKPVITASKSEFWYGAQNKIDSVHKINHSTSLIAAPKQAMTAAENNKCNTRPRSANIPRYYGSNREDVSLVKVGSIDACYKKPIVEYGLVKERAKVSKVA